MKNLKRVFISWLVEVLSFVYFLVGFFVVVIFCLGFFCCWFGGLLGVFSCCSVCLGGCLFCFLSKIEKSFEKELWNE